MVNDSGSNYCSNGGMPLNRKVREALVHFGEIRRRVPHHTTPVPEYRKDQRLWSL